MRITVLFCFAALAQGQALHFGVKGGIPLTDYFVTGGSGSRICACSSSFDSRPVRYTVGLAAEAPLIWGTSLEVDALYQRFHYSFRAGYGFIPRVDAIGGTTGNSWDFPVLLKRRFGPSYVLGGLVMRHLSGLHEVSTQTTVDYPVTLSMSRTTVVRVESSDPSVLRKRWYPGVTVGAGLETRMGRWRLSPELRYTRWTANSSEGAGALYFQGNQVEILLGFGF